MTTYYDGFGRPVTTLLNMLGFARYLRHAHDANGNRTRLTFGYPQAAETHFGFRYDGLDRMILVHDNVAAGHFDDYVVRYWYKPEGPRHAAVRGAGTVGFTTTYYYDGLGRPEAIHNNLPVSGADSSIGLSYNPASQIVSRSLSNDAYAFNRSVNLSRPYRVNGLNQYTNVSGLAYQYDANGNLRTDTVDAWLYDVENRLVSAAGSSSASLVYDPLGRLFQVSSAAGGTTQFLHDGDRIVAEYDGSGTLLKRYVHGPGADEPVAAYEGAALGPASRRYMLPDERGSIIALVDASGVPHKVNGYDSWGFPNLGNEGRFQYTGQAWIGELGLYYYKARFYSPVLGRFMQTDPVGYEDQVNLYAYVGNDPVNHVDPTGEERIKVQIELSGAWGLGGNTTIGVEYDTETKEVGGSLEVGGNVGIGGSAAASVEWEPSLVKGNRGSVGVEAKLEADIGVRAGRTRTLAAGGEATTEYKINSDGTRGGDRQRKASVTAGRFHRSTDGSGPANKASVGAELTAGVSIKAEGNVSPRGWWDAAKSQAKRWLPF